MSAIPLFSRVTRTASFERTVGRNDRFAVNVARYVLLTAVAPAVAVLGLAALLPDLP